MVILAKRLFSAWNTVSNPDSRSPRSKPPAPVKKLSTVGLPLFGMACMSRGWSFGARVRFADSRYVSMSASAYGAEASPLGTISPEFVSRVTTEVLTPMRSAACFFVMFSAMEKKGIRTHPRSG